MCDLFPSPEIHLPYKATLHLRHEQQWAAGGRGHRIGHTRVLGQRRGKKDTREETRGRERSKRWIE